MQIYWCLSIFSLQQRQKTNLMDTFHQLGARMDISDIPVTLLYVFEIVYKCIHKFRFVCYYSLSGCWPS